MALAATVSFSSCSNDDDDEKTCRSCEILTISTEFCDNGDGTVTATVAGQSETISGEDLGDLTPEEYIDSICSASGILDQAE